jgi:signal transduction histidine kinase
MRNPLNGISGNVVFLRDFLDEIRGLIPTSGGSYSQKQPSPQLSSPHQKKKKNNKNETQDNNIYNNNNNNNWDGDLLVSKIMQMHECVDAIDKCVQHQKRMVNDALDFSKLDAHQIHLMDSIFNPGEIVDSVVSMFHSQFIQKNLRVIVQGILPQQPDDNSNSNSNSKSTQVPLLLKGDKGRITQVLINLVSNALKFTNIGSLTINTWIEKGREEATEMLYISVEDTGIGMSEEEVSQVFDRFFQVFLLKMVFNN